MWSRNRSLCKLGKPEGEIRGLFASSYSVFFRLEKEEEEKWKGQEKRAHFTWRLCQLNLLKSFYDICNLWSQLGLNCESVFSKQNRAAFLTKGENMTCEYSSLPPRGSFYKIPLQALRSLRGFWRTMTSSEKQMQFLCHVSVKIASKHRKDDSRLLWSETQ